jgi:hypothetical protein
MSDYANVKTEVKGKRIIMTIDLSDADGLESASGKSMMYVKHNDVANTPLGDIRLQINGFRTIPKAQRKV